MSYPSSQIKNPIIIRFWHIFLATHEKRQEITYNLEQKPNICWDSNCRQPKLYPKTTACLNHVLNLLWNQLENPMMKALGFTFIMNINKDGFKHPIYHEKCSYLTSRIQKSSSNMISLNLFLKFERFEITNISRRHKQIPFEEFVSHRYLNLYLFSSENLSKTTIISEKNSCF